MPKMSLGMVEGKIVKWMKKGGEKVEKGEPLLEIEADKVTADFEAPSSGVLLKITAQEGDVVPVNEPIAFIDAPDIGFPSFKKNMS